MTRWQGAVTWPPSLLCPFQCNRVHFHPAKPLQYLVLVYITQCTIICCSTQSPLSLPPSSVLPFQCTSVHSTKMLQYPVHYHMLQYPVPVHCAQCNQCPVHSVLQRLSVHPLLSNSSVHYHPTNIPTFQVSSRVPNTQYPVLAVYAIQYPVPVSTIQYLSILISANPHQ